VRETLYSCLCIFYHLIINSHCPVLNNKCRFCASKKLSHTFILFYITYIYFTWPANVDHQVCMSSNKRLFSLQYKHEICSLQACILHTNLQRTFLIKSALMHQIAVIIRCDDNSGVRNFKADLFHPSKTFFRLIKSAHDP